MRAVSALLTLALTSGLAATTWAAPSPAAKPAALSGSRQSAHHTDKRFGYRILPPKGWNSIAMKTDEAWLAAKFVSDKSYFFTNPDTKYTQEHTPELLVIAFIKENMKKRKREVSEGGDVKITTIDNPYKNYQDFLDRTYSGGGFYIDSTKETKLKGLPVTIYTVKVEKLTSPKRIVTWIYHTEDIDFALQIEVLETEYKKLKSIMNRSYKSFVEVERTEGNLPTSGKTEDGGWITIEAMNEGTPKERRTKRMTSQEQLHRKAIQALPDDWKHLKSGNILVLSHTDKKYATRVGKHAVVFLKWVEKTFPYVGKGEFVRAPILRVCKDGEEESAFARGVRSGGSYGFTSSHEIVTHKDDAGFIGWEMDYVNRSLFNHWLSDRDNQLAVEMPYWLRNGMREYVEGARAKGSKLDFRKDVDAQTTARMAINKGRGIAARDLFVMTYEEFRNSGGGWEGVMERVALSEMLVRFMMDPAARHAKVSKNLLQAYLEAVKAIAVEEEEKRKASGPQGEKAPQTEEEEAERAKKRQEDALAREKETMQAVFLRVFGDWTEKDWKVFEKSFGDYVSS